MLASFLISFVLFACLPLFQYCNLIASFLLFLGSFLNFPFSDVFQSEMWCDFFVAFPDHLQPLVISVQETVLASNSRKRKTPFVLIWLFVQPRSQAVFSLAWGRGGKSQEKPSELGCHSSHGIPGISNWNIWSNGKHQILRRTDCQ